MHAPHSLDFIFQHSLQPHRVYTTQRPTTIVRRPTNRACIIPGDEGRRPRSIAQSTLAAVGAPETWPTANPTEIGVKVKIMPKISGIVIAHNRESIIEICLKSIRFVDELVVIDNSSNDLSSQIAMRYADVYTRIPRASTIEESLADAVEKCTHELVVTLDDNECLSTAAAHFIRNEAFGPKFDIYRFPIRHYVIGRHDERAYYWPDYRNAFFRRGSIAFAPTVRSGFRPMSASLCILPLDGEACIHHLSYRDVGTRIEKINRCTGHPHHERGFVDEEIASIGSFARGKLENWLSKVKTPDNYLEAVAILRGLYDIIDGLKRWETLNTTEGTSFAEAKRSLEAGLGPNHKAVNERSFTSDWFSHNIPTWSNIFASLGLNAHRPLTAIELGSFEGRASNWMLDHLLGHPDSVLYCVDVFPDRATKDGYWNRFRNNVLTREDATKVCVHIGSTFSFLLNFARRNSKADFIYVDASHRAPDVLSDLILAFRALKVGGVIICDDYLGGTGPGQELTLGSPKIAIDAFTTIFRPQIEIIAGQPLYQLAFVKRVECSEDDPTSRGEASSEVGGAECGHT